MKKYSTLYLLFIAGMVSPGIAIAQERAEGNSVPPSTDGKGHYYADKHHEDVLDYQNEHLANTLNENAPVGVRFPGGPRFAFAGRDDKFYISISGYAKATASYDFGSTLDNPNEFVTSAIDVNPAPGNGGLVQFSAMQSFLALNFVALPKTENKIGFFIGGNFLDDYSPTIQHAYMKWRGLKAGYDYSGFSDVAACPASIDYEGPSAFTAIPTTMVEYSGSFGKKHEWSAGIGVENPMYSVTTGEGSTTVTQRIPDVPAHVKYSWAEGNAWVRVAGILRNMQYRDLIAGKNYNKVGWGVQVSGTAPLTSLVTAYWQGVYGDGIASHIQDLNGLNMDMVPTGDGKMECVKAWGGYVGFQFNFSPKVFATTTYSHVRTYADSYKGGSTPYGEQYRYAQYAQANVFWNLTPEIQTGLEYIYGRRVDYNGAQGHDNRIQTSIQLNF